MRESCHEGKSHNKPRNAYDPGGQEPGWQVREGPAEVTRGPCARIRRASWRFLDAMNARCKYSAGPPPSGQPQSSPL